MVHQTAQIVGHKSQRAEAPLREPRWVKYEVKRQTSCLIETKASMDDLVEDTVEIRLIGSREQKGKILTVNPVHFLPKLMSHPVIEFRAGERVRN